MKIMQGDRPDVTPAQLFAILGAGIPILASLLSSFGVYDLTPAQQDALKETVQWAGLVAIGLFGADAGLRAARNSAQSRLGAQALASPVGPPLGPPAEPPFDDLDAAVPVPVLRRTAVRGASYASGPDLPTDEEEFSRGGPDDEMFESYSFSGLPDADAGPGPDSRLTPRDPEEI